MGTRADFYVGRGLGAKWLGSIAWDGYEVSDEILKAKTEADFNTALAAFLGGRGDATYPKNGWPWPWEDSNTTDYSYAFDDGRTWITSFGHGWFKTFKALNAAAEKSGGNGPKVVFPNMKTDKYAKPNDPRSGIMMLGG